MLRSRTAADGGLDREAERDGGVDGLSAILNFAASFDAKRLGGGSDAQEVDLTIDYRPKQGWLRHFWLRVRGSWLHQQSAAQDGTDFRVILRYDFPVL